MEYANIIDLVLRSQRTPYSHNKNTRKSQEKGEIIIPEDSHSHPAFLNILVDPMVILSELAEESLEFLRVIRR